MPTEMLRVFLSSTGKDLADYRRALMDRLAASDHISVDGMENFGARDASPLEFCRARVGKSDVLVGLIGHYRGWEVEGDNQKRSITEIEFDVATESKKPRLMYVAPDDFAIAAPDETTLVKRRQKKFRERVLKGRVVGMNFISPDRLAAAIVVDLSNLLVERIANQLVAASGARAAPGAAQAITEAVAAAGKGAAEGDDRLRRALALLQEKKVTEAEALFRAVAEEKASRVKEDSKDAASAFRNLGAIAGLADPKRALDAYTRAIELDPTDLDSLFWVAWLHKMTGQSNEAEIQFGQVLTTAKDDELGWYQYWARLGIGDLRLAADDPKAALVEFQKARDIAERRAKAEPDNKLWQRDLAASYERVGDALRQQGNPDAALRSYQACHLILEQLKSEDPQSQHDLAVSYHKLGKAYIANGQSNEAAKSFGTCHAILADLVKLDPANLLWQVDLVESLVSLAESGDNAAERWLLVVETLRRLKAEDKLTAEQTKWLPYAEQQSAALKK